MTWNRHGPPLSPFSRRGKGKINQNGDISPGALLLQGQAQYPGAVYPAGLSRFPSSVSPGVVKSHLRSCNRMTGRLLHLALSWCSINNIISPHFSLLPSSVTGRALLHDSSIITCLDNNSSHDNLISITFDIIK